MKSGIKIIGNKLQSGNNQKRGHFMGTLHLVDHPMIQHKLTIMRDRDTDTKEVKTNSRFFICRRNSGIFKFL